MHMFQKQTLIAYLQFAYNIKSMSDKRLSNGLCLLFNDQLIIHNKFGELNRLRGDEMYVYLINRFKTWKGYSGMKRYPIEIHQDVGVMYQFDMCKAHYRKPWWKRMISNDRFFAKRYTKARRALLDYIISELEHEING